jgi:rhodanese-related sulfurtransferase/DNA-binding transcriptional ArsR family regulator
VSSDTLYEHVAVIGRAVSSSSRLKLLELLSQAERSVQELAAASGLALANASSHLQILRQAGLVASRRDGTRVCYRLADEETMVFLIQVRDFATRHIAGFEKALQERFGGAGSVGLQAMSRAELADRLSAGDVTLLDVRPPREFRAAHIQGAVNIPLPELERQLGRLRGRDVVAYCRGPFCVLSWQAVDLLAAHGIPATRLEDGLPEWQLSGLPVAHGTEGAEG